MCIIKCYTATDGHDLVALVTGYAQEADPDEEEEAAESGLSGSDAGGDDSESLFEHAHAKSDTAEQKQHKVLSGANGIPLSCR